jgi:hypothetical protein
MNKSKLYEQTVKNKQLTEQKSDYLMPNQPDNPAQKGKPGYVDPYKSYPIDPETVHTIADIASFGALFIPGIGLLLSAGIQLGNAALYASEGQPREAGLATVFALLPGIPSLFKRIPGIQGMTKKGIDALIKASQTNKATPAQKVILQKIGLNKEFIKKEIESLVQAKAKANAVKIAASTLSPAKKTVLQKIGQGTFKLGKFGTQWNIADLGYQSAATGYQKAYDWVMPSYEELVKQHEQKVYNAFMKQLKKK